MVLASDDGIGVVVFSNTGGLDGRGVSEPLAGALLRRLLGLPDQVIRTDIPARPESWGELCGWYSPDPGPVTNLFVRALVGAGAEVVVRGGHLVLRPLTRSRRCAAAGASTLMIPTTRGCSESNCPSTARASKWCSPADRKRRERPRS
jgi:hypothetical protein